MYLSKKNNIRQAVDENDIGIELSIFPGFSVPSAYSNAQVNEISLYIIRFAVAMTCIQTGLSILTILTLETAAICMSLLAILFYLLICRYAIRCVKKMNKQTLCFGVTQVTSLKMYFYYLIFTFLFTVFSIIRLAFWIKYHSRKKEFNDSKWAKSTSNVGGKGSVADFWLMAVIYMCSYLVMILLNLTTLFLTYQLDEELKREIRDEELALGANLGQKLVIFPWFSVRSSYDHPKVNRLMTTQLRIAFVFASVQIVIAVLGGVSFSAVDTVFSTLNIIFYSMCLRYAIRCVKKMNKLAWCFCIVKVPSIKMYSYYLYISFLVSLFGFVRIILWIKSHASYSKYNDSKFAKESGPAGGTGSYNEFVAISVLYCIVYSILLVVNLYQMYVAHVLNKILAQEFRDSQAALGQVIGQKLTIFPGFAIHSAYSSPDINTLGQQVLRMSFWMCVIQIAIAIVKGLSEYLIDIIVALVNVVFFLGCLRYSIRVIAKKNKTVKIGENFVISSMQMYILLLFLSLALTVVGFVRVILWVHQNSTRDKYVESQFSGIVGGRSGKGTESDYFILASIFLTVYSIVIISILAQLHTAKKLSRLMSGQVIPINTPTE